MSQKFTLFRFIIDRGLRSAQIANQIAAWRCPICEESLKGPDFLQASVLCWTCDCSKYKAGLPATATGSL